jgi:hypothetical protein
MPGSDEHALRLMADSAHEQSQVLPTRFSISKPKVLRMMKARYVQQCRICKPNVLQVVKVRYISHCAKFVGQVQHISTTRYFLQCGFYKPSTAHDQNHTLTVQLCGDSSPGTL